MQEINTPFPLCRAGRYHVAPWVLMLPLDAAGEQLLDASDGEIEARAAFFDLSLDGRWGGVISGDRVTVDFGTVRLRPSGPTVGSDIVRYADLAAATRSPAPAPSTRTCKGRMTHDRDRAPFFVRGELVEGDDGRAHVAGPRADVHDARARSRRGRSRRVGAAAAARRQAQPRSSTSWSRPAKRSPSTATRTCRSASTCWPRPTRCPAGSSRTCTGPRP